MGAQKARSARWRAPWAWGFPRCWKPPPWPRPTRCACSAHCANLSIGVCRPAPSRPRRSASSRGGWRARRFARPSSPIARRTIWTTTAAWPLTGTPSGPCSTGPGCKRQRSISTTRRERNCMPNWQAGCRICGAFRPKARPALPRATSRWRRRACAARCAKAPRRRGGRPGGSATTTCRTCSRCRPTCAASAGGRGAAGRRRLPARAGPHAAVGAGGPTAGGRGLCPYPRCAGQSPAGPAPAGRPAGWQAVGGVWLRRRPRSRQAPADGRGRRAAGRPPAADQRQPAHRTPGRDLAPDPARHQPPPRRAHRARPRRRDRAGRGRGRARRCAADCRQGPRRQPGSGRRAPAIFRLGPRAARHGGPAAGPAPPGGRRMIEQPRPEPMSTPGPSPAMMTLQQAFALLQPRIPAARLVGAGATPVARVHTDTRTVQAGDLFVALRGPRFDAHAFLAQARAGGAAAALAQGGLADAGLPGIEVPDSLAALAVLAAGWRAQFDLPLIAVTGSNGKTTVTQMVAAILHAWQGDAALATQGNFNNAIGLPLTLLRLRARHTVAVVELGMNHPGEIAALAGIAQPGVALVNNAQREHLEFMHSVAAVARENGSVFASLPAHGVAVFPADDDYQALWQELAAGRECLRFGAGGAVDGADARWVDGAWALTLATPQGPVTTRL